MEIQSQLTQILKNQAQIMRNQILLLVADKAKYGSSARDGSPTARTIEVYENLITNTEHRASITEKMIEKLI